MQCAHSVGDPVEQNLYVTRTASSTHVLLGTIQLVPLVSLSTVDSKSAVSYHRAQAAHVTCT